ncbi:MAG: hypothetical protein SCH71_03500 [Desulfobulbaceae bacterium]|nr:hypothetical protein [Desulfobulbaceae bacterium]
MVEELKKIVRFKDETQAGDHVLVVSKKPQVIVYGLVVSIDRDSSRKDEWWHVRMHLFSLPPQTVVWTLREPQFSGREIFTMQGAEYFMKAVLLDQKLEMKQSRKQGLNLQKKSDNKKNPFHIIK